MVIEVVERKRRKRKRKRRKRRFEVYRGILMKFSS